MYLADPNDFNDEFDVRPQFDMSQIEMRLRLQITEENMRATLRRVGLFHPELVEDVEKSVYSSYERFGGFESWKQAHIQSTIKRLGDNSSAFRSVPRCACLSETNSSAHMWGIYAGSNKGFVVGYKTPRRPPSLCCSRCANRKQGLCDRARINMIPVQYTDRPNLTNYSDVIGGSMWEVPFLTEHEFLAVVAAVSSKRVEWEHEREWRLACIRCPMVGDGPMHAQMSPVSMYLGSGVSDKNRVKLTNVARELGLDLFEEELGYSIEDPEMSFRRVAID